MLGINGKVLSGPIRKVNFYSCATKLRKISFHIFHRKIYVTFLNLATIFCPRLQFYKCHNDEIW